MVFKKHGKEIFGIAFTAKEETALEAEINRRVEERIPEVLRNMEAGIDAEILWFCHVRFGHAKKRLLDDFYSFAPCMEELVAHYELGEDAAPWTAKQKLKDLGVDIDKLRAGETSET